jgi:hypothetical protein
VQAKGYFVKVSSTYPEALFTRHERRGRYNS